ncbi:MAG: RagB/SusD family nutrient uptake outer membrane protein [Chitinophagaceae bacterium]|nr:RagB/SusD family nutrient uptake outer membrane protein [Chitinophagaceae bacterium]MCA6453312.1 RagB/SusD family nutrient uptake outer membrane protein [Chitinophagaceae bacterium]MCA6456687.1 RagB/SusD family nutrient uptake outer membrane protein [Chitinophagaceae bacterium]MCA6459950.1 RagB/SusD family nutrient uptake outer membrane protein [Chitinophagaceae bacterium]MCA6465809.1 RagB/SusD family nutrient uptake outer membrane protein [Chitinophagaceae bacterium]
MKNNKILVGILGVALSMTACKKDLDISNTNQPTPESAQNEAGVISLAQGSIYRNGFYDLKYSDGVYGRFWAGATGFQEMMGDIIGAEAANAFMNQIGCPNKVTLDNGTVVLNPSAINTQYALLRNINNNQQQGSNATYYEWAYMYNMITAANSILKIAESTTFTGAGAATKKATVQAWAYWWKGYAYARIGSIYYAGLIQNAGTTDASTNGNYVTKEAIITESNANFDKCAAALAAATSATDYSAVLAQLLPSFVQKGKGGVLTTAMWQRNINTMKARNILVNTPKSAMTATQWQSILTLVNNGITATDYIFTGRTDPNGDFLGTTIADKIQSQGNATNTYKLSERWVQEFRAGDKRKDNNVRTLPNVGIFNTDRGNAFNTRFSLTNGGSGLPGVIVYANLVAGANEISLCGTYEENELMKAEALIQTNQIDLGVKSIDNVRAYQGAGLAALPAGMTQAAAYEELRSERRIALAFKGLSFYDARRWEIIAPDKSRTGCNVISAAGVLNTNATIVYGFLDYWDVPDNELAYNPPAAGSAAVKNPKQ